MIHDTMLVKYHSIEYRLVDNIETELKLAATLPSVMIRVT